MPKLVCHICQSLKGLIVLRSGLSICPRCLYNLDLEEIAFPAVIRKQFVFSPIIDERGTLDVIGAQLMANFIHNGMPIRAVARQMGVTHTTIYSRLRKYGLIIPNDEDKIRLNPTVSDFAESGGFDPEKRHKFRKYKRKS